MGWETVLYETDGPVVRVTLNRPERRNALDDVLIEELDEAVKQADLDESIRVIIIAGAGKSFSAGHDISGPAPNMEAGGRKARSREAQTTWKDPERRLKREQFLYFDKSLAIRNATKPTIAQVQGPCVAAGLMLACMCDLILAAEDATFQNPVCRMANGSIELLVEPWELGIRKAKELLWTGDAIDAQEAWRLGLVNRVVPTERLAEEAMRLARRIALAPPVAVALTKRSVNHTWDLMGQRASWEYHFMLHHFAHTTDETRSFAEEMRVAPGGLKEFLKRRDEMYRQG
ncbi:MAG: enoyl-CoA hydratase [candidate division NC10 bacterium]|nr:enoyl-CoA hydratase [candidate division NC10 bacterium]